MRHITSTRYANARGVRSIAVKHEPESACAGRRIVEECSEEKETEKKEHGARDIRDDLPRGIDRRVSGAREWEYLGDSRLSRYLKERM